MLHLNYKYPYPHVAIGYDQQWNQEVNNHHWYSIVRADRLGEGAGIDSGVILEGANKEVGHCGDGCEHPGEAQVAAGVPQAV